MAAAMLLTVRWASAANNVMIWDTGLRFADTVEVADKTGWRAVPRDLLQLEANPAKASSDPGYYGREYSFQGDAVLENERLLAVFWSAKGRVAIFSKSDSAPASRLPPKTDALTKVAELTPLHGATETTGIGRLEIVRNGGDQGVIKAAFTAKGSTGVSATFAIDRTEIVEIQPAHGMKDFRLTSRIEYGVAPSFVGDDLIVAPGEHPSAGSLCVPAESIFLGLLNGGDTVLVMTWPKGKQRLNLGLAAEPDGKRLAESIDFDTGGQSFCLAALSAPGIWHREELKPTHLEKDVASLWRKPFPANWKTQLSEAGVKTGFAFREAKGQIWRGVPGSYNYPVWFKDDTAFFHLSKKVPPKGEALIYFLEGQDTPLTISTPVEILKATLGRPKADSILDVAGRKLRTHHRRCEGQVHRACTCGYTEAIQAVFESGEEVNQKQFIAESIEDMIYFVQQHLARIDEYRQFSAEMIKFLRTQGNSAPELKPFLENLEAIAQRIPQEYEVQNENMKSLAHAEELTRQTMALTNKKEPGNLKAYMELLKAWRAMGGAQDYVVAQCHTITRKLFQEAGRACLEQSKALELAKEIRARCRQILRNPDGYEIWADY